jgi:hypothetical protein
MIATCPYCNKPFDTAKLISVPADPRPIDRVTKQPIDVTKESHVLTGQPEINKQTVKNPRTGLYPDGSTVNDEGLNVNRFVPEQPVVEKTTTTTKIEKKA